MRHVVIISEKRCNYLSDRVRILTFPDPTRYLGILSDVSHANRLRNVGRYSGADDGSPNYFRLSNSAIVNYRMYRPSFHLHDYITVDSIGRYSGGNQFLETRSPAQKSCRSRDLIYLDENRVETKGLLTKCNMCAHGRFFNKR